MIDEINAGIADDSQSMDVITRRTRTIMEPVTDDIDDIEIANFMGSSSDRAAILKPSLSSMSNEVMLSCFT